MTGGASWRRVQRPLHSTLKAFRVQMGPGNGRPVFKEYCRPFWVNNSEGAQKPDLGAFKATTSSTVPSGTSNDSAYSRIAVSFAARTTLWPLSTVVCCLAMSGVQRPLGQ